MVPLQESSALPWRVTARPRARRAKCFTGAPPHKMAAKLKMRDSLASKS